jgi:hypothetical protein
MMNELERLQKEEVLPHLYYRNDRQKLNSLPVNTSKHTVI